MFTVKLPSKEGEDVYEISFEHSKPLTDEEKALVGNKFVRAADKPRRMTTCYISLNGETIFHSHAVCSCLDNFCKATGRKVSLASALLGTFPDFEDKDVRRVFWAEYFKRSKKV